MRHGRIDFTREFNETRGEIVFLGFPGEVKRIDRNAVAAQSRSGVEGRVPKRLAAGCIDHFPDIDVHAIRKKLELVDKRDIDRTIDVLEELDQFGCPRGGNRYDAIDNLSVEDLAHFETIRRNTAYD